MTNYEKWKTYTKNLPSPESYVDFAFYWLISTCLQRRVWYYSGDLALYPNMYLALIGPPAVGKGLILGLTNDILRFHKYEKGIPIQTNAGPELPLLFPVGADSTTFEDLVDDMCKSIRRLITPGNTPYSHTSYAFVLEELDSLFKHKTEDVARFLKNAYDCKNFEYTTKHQGEFRLRKPCLSFFAAANESFLRDAYKKGLFGEGFMSRCLFVFEKQPRFFAFHISGFDDDQNQAKYDLLLWIKSLSELYGEITYEQETAKYLDTWYLESVRPKLLHLTNERMQEYYGRKKVTMLKIAAGMHFAEHLSMTVPLETFKRAISLLDSIEPAMAKAINFAGRNETHFYLLEILEYIAKEKTVSLATLIRKFGAEVEILELGNILKELEMGYGIVRRLTGEQVSYEIPKEIT